MQFSVSAGGILRGELRVASDKSISHRAVLLASLANGTSQISKTLKGEDVRATIAAMRACGVEVSEDKDVLTIKGRGWRLVSPDADIDCGNSGTLARLFCGMAAASGITARLVGDDSLMHRPMQRVTRPLLRMGADITAASGGTLPLEIKPAKNLCGTAHRINIASAQVKSAILLAGLCAQGTTSVTEPLASRDHTERMLEVFGVTVRRDEKRTISVSGGGVLSPARFKIPADISSAAFFMVGAAITQDSEILLTETGVNPTRAGIIELLRRMGARIEVLNVRQMGAEPIADILVIGGDLRGINISADDVPSAIDEFPALLIAAACAKGQTIISGAGELRHKESDRISAMVEGLRTLGVECEEDEDGVIIEGQGHKDGVFTGGSVDSFGDHRIAMAFAMAALRAKDTITISDCANVATSFPDFVKQAIAVGLRIALV